MNRINQKNFALALGILVGAGAFLTGLAGWLFGVWREGIEIWAKFYIGFGPSFGGSVIGAIWGLLDGFIGGWIFAWLYNRFQG